MPIRINLLAEAQAAEELRRRDPVKRAIWVGAFLVFLVLLWSSSLWVQSLVARNGLSSLQGSLGDKTNEYNKIIANEYKLHDIAARLDFLNNLVTNRFFYAPLLDVFQHSPVEGIQFIKLHAEQSYDLTPEVPSTKVNGKTIPRVPPTSTEKIRVIIEARDNSENPGAEQIKLFRETLAQSAYFQGHHISTNDIKLDTVSPPQLDAATGTNFVLFTVQCLFPNHTR